MTLKIGQKKINIIIAKSFKKRLLGLMNQTNINYGMLFPNCNSVHTFMMRENIDIIGLDNNNKVIYIAQNIPKNKIIRVAYPQNKTSILELPKNASKDIKIGQIIMFE